MPETPSDEQDLIDALAQTAFVVTASLNRIAADHDLSLTQLRVLAILRDRRLRMSELADFLGLEKSTLSGLVDRAERRGLLSRAPSPDDRRAVDVQLASQGFALVEVILPEVARALQPLTGSVAAADRRRLTTLLTSLLAAGPRLTPPRP